MDIFKQEILNMLKKEVENPEIEVPPNPELGDYAFPCFSLTKRLGKNPNEIAVELSGKLARTELVKDIKATGPYVNFFINKDRLSDITLRNILDKKKKYGMVKDEKEKIVVEFSSPNTNKPMHLGHARNNFLGAAISNLLKFNGNKVLRTNLINDRGIHICKSMLAYKEWGDNKTPKTERKKSDHFVGDFYVLFNEKSKEDPELEKKAQDMLVRYEQRNRDVIKLWKKMNKWAVKGLKKTYKATGIKFDKIEFEHNVYEKGKDIIFEALKKDIAHKNEDGAVVIDLEEYGLGKKVLLSADGTSIDITQDLGLAKQRYDKLRFDSMIYVTGSEQDYHFNVLFKTLELMGFAWAKRLCHLSYGMVNLPSGKMKSREGTVVDLDDIVDEMIELARKEIVKRYKHLSPKKIEKRAKVIGLGALKFFLLKFDPKKDMLYDPEESISFEGETGPYVQYAHARICSILKKHGKRVNRKASFQLFNDQEKALAKQLSEFPSVVSEASYKPSVLCHYLVKLSQEFNTYYVNNPILTQEPVMRDGKLVLILCIKQVLSNGLKLLGIKAPKRM